LDTPFRTINMNPSEESLRTLFAKNRTEELGADVYKHFVVPPFFDKLDFRVARKPRLFIGGRGCGKTMLLRYFSHQSAFSKDRTDVPEDEVEHIGLYWRVDTQFAAVMNERGLAEDIWQSAFNHLITLLLGIQIFQSIKNIALSDFRLLDCSEVEKANFDRLSVFDPTFLGGLDRVQRAFEDKLWEFELWVANVRKSKEPTFLPGVQFLTALISHVKQVLPSLQNAQYFVYVDEFENLLPYQQRILNTCLKHSETPLIFNIAMKRHAFETIKTVGEESIQNIADYRTYDLEELLLDNDFPVFAAEVLFLNLSLAGVNDIPIVPKNLRDPNALKSRKEKSYQGVILNKIHAVLPGLSHEQLAEKVFENESLKRRVCERIDVALKSRQSNLKGDMFFRPNFPQATITVTALLYRQRLSPEEIACEFDLLEAGHANKFTGVRGWIHNNFIGCLLWLYESHSSPCPLFSGFATFCLLARGNLRHFLELCHTSLNQISNGGETNEFEVPPILQAKAAHQASAAFLHEIPAFGRLGDRLHTFAFRLGSLFALAHRRPTQSEPEQNHFAITSGSKPLSHDSMIFLHEAEKWSVIFKEEETKIKTDIRLVSFEYVLNPIYSPYFNITYRKKRKLDLSADDLEVLICGGYDEATGLLRRFSKQWEIDEESNLTLIFQFAEDSAR
jgi:hypothetical protein